MPLHVNYILFSNLCISYHQDIEKIKKEYNEKVHDLQVYDKKRHFFHDTYMVLQSQQKDLSMPDSKDHPCFLTLSSELSDV